MIWVNIKRVSKSAFISFWRNGWVTVATVLVMVVSLSVLGSLIFGRAVLLTVLSQLEDKVDITVYFKTDATQSDMDFLRDSLAKQDEIKAMEFISREDALVAFKTKHVGNDLIIQSIEELDDNPLGASLNIKAKDPAQYESISKFLETGVFSAIDKINYSQNKLVIDRLASILLASKKVGAGISVILGLIALLVTFNTIRLAIYTNKEEIKIMRLVGASNRYIRSPFMLEGILYGLVAAFVTMLLFYPVTLWLGPLFERFFGGVNLFYYYLANFFQLFAVLVVVGGVLGGVSSWVATRRYLKA